MSEGKNRRIVKILQPESATLLPVETSCLCIVSGICTQVQFKMNLQTSVWKLMFFFILCFKLWTAFGNVHSSSEGNAEIYTDTVHIFRYLDTQWFLSFTKFHHIWLRGCLYIRKNVSERYVQICIRCRGHFRCIGTARPDTSLLCAHWLPVEY